MIGEAVCKGAATIITGFATGAAGAYGIALENKTKVTLTDDGGISSIVNGEEDVGSVLAESAVKRTCDFFNQEYSGAIVETLSDIPHAAGLKSSSIAANAIVLATVGAIAAQKGKIKDRKLGKGIFEQQINIEGVGVKDIDLINIGIDAAFDAKVTKTGAIDDASAAYFGGYTITQNLKREIVYMGGMEDLDVVIYLPDTKIYSGQINPLDVKPFAKEVDMLWDAARAGKIYSAITLNGLIHCLCFKQDPEPAKAALSAGALAAGLSGTGPAVVAICRDETGAVEDAFSRFDGQVIKTKTNNEKARVTKWR